MPLVCFWKDPSQKCCVYFFPHAGGFGGCRGCGTCFTCPYFQRRQFLLLSSHRQGKPGKEWTKQQQNLSFFTMRVVFPPLAQDAWSGGGYLNPTNIQGLVG